MNDLELVNINDIIKELVNSNYNDCQFRITYDEKYDIEINMKKIEKGKLWVMGTYNKEKNTYQM